MKPNQGKSATKGTDLETANKELLDTEGMAQIATAEQHGEIQAAAVIAKKFPRNEAACRAELLEACKLNEFAGNIDDPTEPSAYYSFPRGKKQNKTTGEWIPNIVSGASVKLAREITRIYGNIRYGFLITHDDDESRGITGWAWDLEKNLPIYGSDFFKKLIQRKQSDGSTQWIIADERELRELTSRKAAFLIRNSLFGLFPGYLINQAVKICKETVGKAKSGETNELKDRIEKMLLAFTQYGISATQLITYLHKPLSECTDADLGDLRGIYEAIKDGLISPDERQEMFGSQGAAKENDGSLSEEKFRSRDPAPDAINKAESKATRAETAAKGKGRKSEPAKKKESKPSVTTESLLKMIAESNKNNFGSVKTQVIKNCTKGIEILKITNALNDRQNKLLPKN